MKNTHQKLSQNLYEAWDSVKLGGVGGGGLNTTENYIKTWGIHD